MKIDKKALRFLKKHRVCAFSTQLKDGSPHNSALHYSHNEKDSEVYISTENNSRKCEALLTGKSVKGSFVVGFDESEFVTLQMDGDVKIEMDRRKLLEIYKIHYKKHPDSEKWKDDPATVFLVFKPSWYRYTEYKPKFVKIESK